MFVRKLAVKVCTVVYNQQAQQVGRQCQLALIVALQKALVHELLYGCLAPCGYCVYRVVNLLCLFSICNLLLWVCASVISSTSFSVSMVLNFSHN